ncbi:hypothetical protein [Polaromonas sp.]|uniref:hypothetical protein n=1 Tax=Polaromonas sp. TaxID=1869339 RepID=UPI003BB63453
MSFLIPICRVAAVALSIFLTTASQAADPLTLIEAQRMAVARSQQLVAQQAQIFSAREQALAAGQPGSRAAGQPGSFQTRSSSLAS